jgi:hypothetical protein
MKSNFFYLFSIIVLLAFVTVTSAQYGQQQTTYEKTTHTKSQPGFGNGQQQSQTTVTKTTTTGNQSPSYSGGQSPGYGHGKK